MPMHDVYLIDSRVHRSRIRIPITHPISEKGTCVLYGMQSALRFDDNPAYFRAREWARARNLPLVVAAFGDTGWKHATEREWGFIIQSWKDLYERAAHEEISFFAYAGLTKDLWVHAIRKFSPAVIIADEGYASWSRNWREYAAQISHIHFEIIDCNLVVPVLHASPKREWAAYTFRPKVYAQINDFMKEEYNTHSVIFPKVKNILYDPLAVDLTLPLHSIIAQIKPSSRARLVDEIKGGETSAKAQLQKFLQHGKGYALQRNQPGIEALSGMSPYLHHGCISPRTVLKEAKKSLPTEDFNALQEEMVVRRELAHNFVHYETHFRSLKGCDKWARETLAKHKKDKRPYLYTLEQLENALTHDASWNAAQNQMRITGKMHGYMRMYWAKKILEWTPYPEIALSYTIQLNDIYELDGGDPNGWVGALWAIGGLHDRAWPERPIFGKIRYMNEAGLIRKIKTLPIYIHKYTVQSVDKLK